MEDDLLISKTIPDDVKTLCMTDVNCHHMPKCDDPINGEVVIERILGGEVRNQYYDSRKLSWEWQYDYINSKNNSTD